MAPVTDTKHTDGRSLRRTRNREAVLDAVIAIFESGDLTPAMDDIAERAGVSNRSIYRYFDHRDQLIRAAVTHAMRRVIVEIEFDDVGVGGFVDRVSRFVEHRLAMYQRLAPITRAAQVAAVSEPVVAEEFEIGRYVLRQQFLEHFAPEFSPLSAGETTRAVLAADIAFQFEAFEYLWRATEGSVGEMRAVLIDHLEMTIGRLRSRSVVANHHSVVG